MKFPLLIKIKQTKHVVNSIDEFPIGVQMTILRSNFSVDNITLEDVTYRRKDDKEKIDDQTRQENIEPSEPDSAGFDTSSKGGEDGSSASSQERNNKPRSRKSSKPPVSKTVFQTP